MSRISRKRRVGHHKGSDGEFQTINITPFTDVLLVLLIIFLIAGSSLNPTGVDVDKLATTDQSTTSSKSPEKERVLFVGQTGSLMMSTNGGAARKPDLASMSRELDLTLTAHPETKVDSLVNIYDELLRKGFRNVHLGQPRKKI